MTTSKLSAFATTSAVFPFLRATNAKLRHLSASSARLSVFWTTSTEGAEFADGFAGVIGWTFAIDMDNDPGLEGGDTFRWFRNFLTFKYASYKPQRWPSFRKVKFLRLAEETCQFA